MMELEISDVPSNLGTLAQTQPGGRPSSQNESIQNSKVTKDILSLIEQLTTEEKVALLSGVNFVMMAGVPRLNIPAIKTSDSTSAVKGASLYNGTSTACFPCTSALAATWDCSLIKNMGVSVAAQARYKAAQVVLGPTINIQRDPRAGRNFEAFSEDPVLTGWMAASFTAGIQSQGVGACTKHFVANESETQRRKCNSRVDERTLRELYLSAFQWVVREAKPTAIMTSYNKVNGIYACEMPLIKDILREEWGFEGMVMSDWYGTTSRLGALEAGLDLEMPGPTVFRGAGLVDDVKSGLVSTELLDQRTTEVLKFISRLKDAYSTAEESSGQDSATSVLCRKIAAESMVLLKNENSVLPLCLQNESFKKVAVIGKHSLISCSGGGSASGPAQYIQRPYDHIRAAHSNPELVKLAEGVQVHKVIPIISSAKLLARNGKHGVDVTYWNDGIEGPVLEEHLPMPHMVMIGKLKDGLKETGFHYKISTNLTPTTTGLHTLAVQATGSFRLLVNGQEVLRAEEPEITMEDFLFVPATHEFRASVQMTAQQSYQVQISSSSMKPREDGEPVPHSTKLCLLEQVSDEDAIQEASAVTEESDIAIVFAGRNSEWEGEGSDLDNMRLMDSQIAQIKAVAASSRKTNGKVVVVLYGGNPFDVSEWIDDVDGLVLAHFPGQEGGAALADVLTGTVNPSGKLSMSWPKSIEVTPTYADFPGKDMGHGVEVDYKEGLKLGYRFYDQDGRQNDVRWNFGFGLSYTTFSLSNLQVHPRSSEDDGDKMIHINLTVKNTGQVAGAEVVQAYVEDVESTVWRPKKELKSFAKVFLEPGEERVVKLSMVEKYALSFWDVQSGSWLAESGSFRIHVGPLSSEYTLQEDYRWNGV